MPGVKLKFSVTVCVPAGIFTTVDCKTAPEEFLNSIVLFPAELATTFTDFKVHFCNTSKIKYLSAFPLKLDPPPNTDLDLMQTQTLSKDEEGLFNYTENIVDKINYLESNPEIKEQYKNLGKQYILDNFNIEKIGKMWKNYINQLVN